MKLKCVGVCFGRREWPLFIGGEVLGIFLITPLHATDLLGVGNILLHRPLAKTRRKPHSRGENRRWTEKNMHCSRTRQLGPPCSVCGGALPCVRTRALHRCHTSHSGIVFQECWRQWWRQHSFFNLWNSYLFIGSSKNSKLYIHFDQHDELFTMVKFISSFEIGFTCENKNFLQNIWEHRNSWNSLDN